MRLSTAGLILTLGIGILSAPSTHAQQPAKVPRIGWPSLSTGREARAEAFRQGLRELGYVEGQNVAIESRFADRREDRLAELASELVRLKVDVIVALEPPALRAAKKATRTIPIVMRSSGDPVEEGYVASLARPGGNITGVFLMTSDLGEKRLELLKEIVPRVPRIAVLWNPDDPAAEREWRQTQVAARKLGVPLKPVEIRAPEDIDAHFSRYPNRVSALSSQCWIL